MLEPRYNWYVLDSEKSLKPVPRTGLEYVDKSISMDFSNEADAYIALKEYIEADEPFSCLPYEEFILIKTYKWVNIEKS